ncbi:hypothetical protein [Burkholderia multivorans]|uniref:hypothetical protein n=1 Tax=Burkholderia multivorans TaxID=87883 RepID=UPI0021AD1A16
MASAWKLEIPTGVGFAGEASADDAERVLQTGDRMEAEVDREEDRGGHEPDDDERDAEVADAQLEEDDAAEGLRDRPEEGLDRLVDSGGLHCVGGLECAGRGLDGRELGQVFSYGIHAHGCE